MQLTSVPIELPDTLSTRRYFALILMLIIAFQCLQPMDITPADFQESYWLVNYDFGFVRRGLGGEVLQLIGGGPVSSPLMFAAVWSTALLPVAALAGLVMLLARHGTTASIAVAALIACSPWTFETLWGYRRPDQYGLVALIAIGLVLWGVERHRRLPWLALIGLALGGLVFVHEASVAVWGIGGLVLVALAREPMRWRVLAATVLFWPALLAVLIVLAAGSAGQTVMSGLTTQPATAVFLPPGAGVTESVLPFLDDTVTNSMQLVAAIPLERKLLMSAWILVTLVVHVGWLVMSRVRGLGGDGLTVVAIAVMGMAATLVFATGIDWQRWACAYGTVALVILAFQVLSRPAGTDGSRSWSGQVAAWMIAAGIYLATRRPAAPDGDPDLISYIQWWL